MKEKVAIVIGILLLVGGAFGAVITYQNAESGSSFLSVMGKGLVAKGLSQEAAQSKGQKIPVIVAYQPVSKGLSVKGLSVRAQDMKAMAVRRLGVYGFTLSHEEAIPMFGMVVGKAPAENISKMARSPGVRAVVKNKFISVGGETRLFAQSYARPEEFVRFHEANELPAAKGQVIAIVDSRAPREPWVENAVSVRGQSPYSGFWHGNLVSRVSHRVAPNAEITVVKTLDEYGTGRLSTILKGLETAATMKPRADVINLSLGTSPGGIYQPLNIACNTIEREYPHVKVLSVASGNTSHGPATSPATAKSTLAVGAITPKGKVADYSSSVYDVLAIGNVRVGGRSACGTSFAAPIASGLLSRYLSLHREMKNINAKKTFVQSAKMFQKAGRELPILKGSNIAKTKPVKESTPIEKTAPYIVTSIVGFVVIFWGIEGEDIYGK